MPMRHNYYVLEHRGGKGWILRSAEDGDQYFPTREKALVAARRARAMRAMRLNAPCGLRIQHDGDWVDDGPEVEFTLANAKKGRAA